MSETRPSNKQEKVWAVYDAGRLHAVELTEEKARARRNLMPHADKVTIEATFLSSATLSKFFIWTGGKCPQEWLCKDIPEVQAALCEALYGRAEDADADEIGKYLSQVQEMTGRDLEYEYEDGWLQIIKLHVKQQYVNSLSSTEKK